MKLLQLTPAFIMLLCISCMAQKKISAKNATQYPGQDVQLCDNVYKTEVDAATNNTVLYLGTPAQYAVVLVKQQSSKFKWHPETQFKGHAVCVTGKVATYHNKPAIYVTENNQLKLDLPDSPAGNK